MMLKTVRLLFVLILLSTEVATYAQSVPAPNDDKAERYTKTITDRSDKIVAKLGITDEAKRKRVLDVIINQYRLINDVHESRDAKVAEIKKQAAEDKIAAAEKIKTANDELEEKMNGYHKAYLSKLSACLTPIQIEKVKDEMTYNKVAVTYNAYLAEILTLTDEQKAQLKAWLVEARELAMDGESSKRKDEIFGKYKGRINNYLSKQGYDMKKEGEEWQKRIKASSGKE